jgi:hypothetical protein
MNEDEKGGSEAWVWTMCWEEEGRFVILYDEEVREMTSWVVKQWKEISHAGGLDEVLAGLGQANGSLRKFT